MKQTILPITLAGVWILASEFIRNELLLKHYWVQHFDSLDLIFETLPINAILWSVWSLILAYIILKLLQKFSFWETIYLTWIGIFFMMWITCYNLQVLPLDILFIALPWSFGELILAGIILQKYSPTKIH